MSQTDVPAERLSAETAEMAKAIETGSFAPAFEQCIELAHKEFGVNFAATAAPHGGSWPPRKKIGDGHPLEIKSGDLFQAETSDFGKGSIKQVGDREAFTGVDPGEVPYAAAQNYGRSEINLPARESEDVDEAALDAMAEEMADRGLELLMQR